MVCQRRVVCQVDLVRAVADELLHILDVVSQAYRAELGAQLICQLPALGDQFVGYALELAVTLLGEDPDAFVALADLLLGLLDFYGVEGAGIHAGAAEIAAFLDAHLVIDQLHHPEGAHRHTRAAAGTFLEVYLYCHILTLKIVHSKFLSLDGRGKVRVKRRPPHSNSLPPGERGFFYYHFLRLYLGRSEHPLRPLLPFVVSLSNHERPFVFSMGRLEHPLQPRPEQMLWATRFVLLK